MSSQTGGESGSQDVLVISDSAGNLYLIRRETLEGGKVIDKARAEQWINKPEVSGFAAGPSYEVVKTIKVPPPPSPTHSIRDTLRNL